MSQATGGEPNPETLPTRQDLSGKCPRCGRVSNFRMVNHEPLGVRGAPHGTPPQVLATSQVTVIECMGCNGKSVVIEAEIANQGGLQGVLWWPTDRLGDLERVAGVPAEIVDVTVAVGAAGALPGTTQPARAAAKAVAVRAIRGVLFMPVSASAFPVFGCQGNHRPHLTVNPADLIADRQGVVQTLKRRRCGGQTGELAPREGIISLSLKIWTQEANSSLSSTILRAIPSTIPAWRSSTAATMMQAPSPPIYPQSRASGRHRGPNPPDRSARAAAAAARGHPFPGHANELCAELANCCDRVPVLVNHHCSFCASLHGILQAWHL
jgi:hypothetical protein